VANSSVEPVSATNLEYYIGKRMVIIVVLKPYQQWCYVKLGEAAKRSLAKRPDYLDILRKAQLNMLPEVYVAQTWMSTIIAAIVGICIAIVLDVLFVLRTGNIIMLIGVNLIPPLLIFGVYVGYLKAPSFIASARARKINAYLPYAANFTAAMAAANATPQKIFRSLAIQEAIYGEISIDAGRIYRDITLLGLDLITALKNAISRSPSMRYVDFLQGMVSTLQSGGSLKVYFGNKAETFMRENRREQESFLETLSFMAESYVVVAVAMPIFLMVILVIMYWVSGAGLQVGDLMLNLIIFVMLPIIHFGYIGAIYIITPEV
jgi:flagellar protein FlaJ